MRKNGIQIFGEFFLFLLLLSEKCKGGDLTPLAQMKVDVDYLIDSSEGWWRTASFYQIYPRSFKDSNGDGIGDLNGITQQLGYLKSLGIQAAWLSPIYKSPMADFGYDVANYYEIQPEYGTLDDFDRLIQQANSLNIKIILDFVPNHSSDEHEWFKKSVNREPGYEDFYIWHSGYPDEKNSSNRLPPSNWISLFRKSAWQWNEQRGAFYFHQFLKKQPDLNYRNPTLVEEMKKILVFWMDRGVYGFRIDAVPYLFEVRPDPKSGRIPNEPESGKSNDKESYDYLNHVFTVDQPETIDMVYQWRKLLTDYGNEHGGDNRVMMTESYSSLNIVAKYYGNGTHDGSHIPFNFQWIMRLWNESNAYDYIACIDDWMKIVPEKKVANWVIGNHDQSRVASRLGTDRIDIINMMILTLPGISITYNGEEIGMTDQWLSWNDTVDPAACNSNPKIYEHFTRDPERTPFQWNKEKNAGFSTADKTWLPVANNYMNVNVRREDSIDRSHLKVYRSLQDLRKENPIKYGQTKYLALNQQVLAIARFMDGEKIYVTIVNVGPSTEQINLKALEISIPKNLYYHIVSVESPHKINEKVLSSKVTLRPKEGIILRSQIAVYQKKNHGLNNFTYRNRFFEL